MFPGRATEIGWDTDVEHVEQTRLAGGISPFLKIIYQYPPKQMVSGCFSIKGFHISN